MALKQIEKDQVRAGMWIHAIKGVWFFHPFWRGKFLLEHSDDVDALRSARISGVIIDTDKAGERVGGSNAGDRVVFTATVGL